MIGSNSNRDRTLSIRSETERAIDGVSIEQYPEQLHADFDPVYSMLMNYRCAVMGVETSQLR